MNALKTFLLHLITGIDNHTPDIARLLWVVTCLSFIALGFVHVLVNKQPFDPLAYGTGAGGVLAGGGLGIAVKAKTEPSG